MSDEDAGTLEEAIRRLRTAAEPPLGIEELSGLDFSDAQLVRFSPELPATLEEQERKHLLEHVRKLEPWLQGPFALGGDLVIGGAWRNDLRWQRLRPHVPELEGRRVLDVGSNAGYDPFMFKLQGAAEVIACEPFDFIRQMEFLEGLYRTGIAPLRLGWQQLDPQVHGTFDIVHCHGLLHHEMHPVALLQRLRAMLSEDGTLLFGSIMLADPELSEHARYVPGSYHGDPTWWWVPGRLAMRWMLESVGLAVQEAFSISDGPPGEFRTVSGYFRTRSGEPSTGVTLAS